jgi:hypothetical protein
MKSFRGAPLWTSPMLCSPRHALAAAWREPSRCAWYSLALSFVPVRSNSIRAHSPHRIDNCLRSSSPPRHPARNGAEAFPFLPLPLPVSHKGTAADPDALLCMLDGVPFRPAPS